MLNAKSYITVLFVSAQMAIQAILSSIASRWQVCSVEHDSFFYKILKFIKIKLTLLTFD